MSKSYGSDAEIRRVVERFERCDFALAEFDHAAHLAVALVRLREVPFEAAVAQMRADLMRFSAHHKATGYNETITRFWLRLVETYLLSHPEEPLWKQVNGLVEHLGDKQILFRHYSKEWVMSAEAKAGWVEPDLLAMPDLMPSLRDSGS